MGYFWQTHPATFHTRIFQSGGKVLGYAFQMIYNIPWSWNAPCGSGDTNRAKICKCDERTGVGASDAIASKKLSSDKKP